MNKLNFYYSKLTKKKYNESKESRKKEIIQIKTEVNVIGNAIGPIE